MVLNYGTIVKKTSKNIINNIPIPPEWSCIFRFFSAGLNIGKNPMKVEKAKLIDARLAIIIDIIIVNIYINIQIILDKQKSLDYNIQALNMMKDVCMTGVERCDTMFFRHLLYH